MLQVDEDAPFWIQGGQQFSWPLYSQVMSFSKLPIRDWLDNAH